MRSRASAKKDLHPDPSSPKPYIDAEVEDTEVDTKSIYNDESEGADTIELESRAWESRQPPVSVTVSKLDIQTQRPEIMVLPPSPTNTGTPQNCRIS